MEINLSNSGELTANPNGVELLIAPGETRGPAIWMTPATPTGLNEFYTRAKPGVSLQDIHHKKTGHPFQDDRYMFDFSLFILILAATIFQLHPATFLYGWHNPPIGLYRSYLIRNSGSSDARYTSHTRMQADSSPGFRSV